MTLQYPLVAGAKNAEQGRDIKVDSLQWVTVPTLPVSADQGQVVVLTTDGLAYQWWDGAWRPFSGGGDLTADKVLYTNTAYPLIANVQEALDKILYSNPSITSFNNNIGTVETGVVVTSVNLSWSYNKTVVSQSLASPGPGSIAPSLRALIVASLNLTSDTVFNLTASDGTNSVSGNTYVSFRNKRYWGVSSNPSLVIPTVLSGSEFASGRQQSRSMSAAGQYLYFAWPSSFGVPSFVVNGLPVSGWVQTTVAWTNASGYTTNYDIWRSQYIQSGSGIAVVVN